MCLNPKWIYKKGNYKENNYRGMAGEFYELGTYSKCGHCEICIAEKANNWVIRNKYEAESAKNGAKCFITLTYKENPYILIKKDLQNFFKRLRAYLKYNGFQGKIRYYGAGEYGSLNNRPHFHAIIYGWQDTKADYLTINKKMNIVYQSEIIEKCWGLGRTSYQKFDEHEAPYIALYETARESWKKGYKVTREKLKTLEEIYRRQNISKGRRIMLGFELLKLREELENSKAKYMKVKEFNTWSLGLGWEEFERQYEKAEEYTFEEYIEDKAFVTPTPWIKKLANSGDIKAAEEMKRREELIKQSANELEEKLKNQLKVAKRKKEDLKKWGEEKTVIEYL